MEELTPRSIYNFIDTLSDEHYKLTKEVEHLKKTTITTDKFYNAILTTKEVAKIHKVQDALVRKYVSLHMIPTHPDSTDARLLIRCSDALLIDFTILKQQAKNIRK